MRADDRSTGAVAAPRRSPARPSKLDLVRRLVLHRRWCDRLVAESEGRSCIPPEPVAPARLAGIRTRQAAVVEARREHLQDVLDALAYDELDPTPKLLAAGMRERLGRFRVEQLYRPALIDLWDSDADWFGKREEDRMAGAAKIERMSRKAILRELRRVAELIVGLQASRAAELLVQSEAEGWTRLDPEAAEAA